MSTWAIESLRASLRGRREAMLDFAEHLEDRASGRRRGTMRKVAGALRMEAARVQHDLDHVFGGAVEIEPPLNAVVRAHNEANALRNRISQLESELALAQRQPEEKRMGFNRSDFDGAVLLKHWTPDLDGRTYRGYVGKVSILKDKELLDFEVTGTESNWVARVQGSSGQSVNFPGCQVQAVFVEPNEETVSNDYKVLA